MYLQLVKNFLSANRDREKKNFLRICIPLYLIICIGILRAAEKSNVAARHPTLVLEAFGAGALAAVMISLLFQVALVSLLAYSTAFRRAREASISVPAFLRSAEYDSDWGRLLKMPPTRARRWV